MLRNLNMPSFASPSSAVNSYWTASRGGQTINCELTPAGEGPAILRCGYGTQGVIRSQFIASEQAAFELSETWKAALLLQGFLIESTPVARC